MNFQPLTLVLFLAFLAVGTVRAILLPLRQNLLRLAAVPVAFLCSLFLQFAGIQRAVAGFLMDTLGLAGEIEKALPESPDAVSAATAMIGAAIGTVFTALFFVVFLIVLRAAVIPPILKKIGDGADKADNAAEKKKGCPAGKAISAVCGLVSGFLILGICLSPVFLVMECGAEVSAAAHEEADLNSAYQKKALLVCETFVDPFWDSVAIRPYRALGISALLGRCAAVGNSFRNAEGDSVSAVSALHTLCGSGAQALFLLDSDTGSDAALGDDLAALFSDPVPSGICADLVVSEAASLRDTGEGRLLSVSREGSGVALAAADVAIRNYSGASHAQIRSDLLALAGAASVLGETDFFNEVMQASTREAALTAILEDDALLEQMLYRASEISICDELMQTVFEEEIEDIAEMLDLPDTAATADSAAVTAEQMKSAVDFDCLTGENREEEVRCLIRSVVRIVKLYSSVKNENGIDMTALVDHLGDLGAVLDALLSAETTHDLPPLILEGLSQNETFRRYVSASVVCNLNDSVAAGTTTYESFLVSLQGLLQAAAVK